jgi:hypothetical protein
MHAVNVWHLQRPAWKGSLAARFMGSFVPVVPRTLFFTECLISESVFFLLATWGKRRVFWSFLLCAGYLLLSLESIGFAQGIAFLGQVQWKFGEAGKPMEQWDSITRRMSADREKNNHHL